MKTKATEDRELSLRRGTDTSEVQATVALLDTLIERTRRLSPAASFCLVMGRDELITSFSRRGSEAENRHLAPPGGEPDGAA